MTRARPRRDRPAPRVHRPPASPRRWPARCPTRPPSRPPPCPAVALPSCPSLLVAQPSRGSEQFDAAVDALLDDQAIGEQVLVVRDLVAAVFLRVVQRLVGAREGGG